MKAIETTGRIDQKGLLKLDQPLKARGKNVEVIVLMQDDDSPDDDKTWLSTLSDNPALNFLKEPEEDVCTISDGKPLND